MKLKEGDITIYADGFGLAVYGDGSPKPPAPSNEWLPAKHYLTTTDPFVLLDSDVERALEVINLQAEDAGGYTIIDEDTGDILEHSTYSAF